MEQKLRVWAAIDTNEDAGREHVGTKGIFSSDEPQGSRAEAMLVELDAHKLGGEMARTIQTIRTIVPDEDSDSSGLLLKSVTVGLELSAEGGITLVGTLKAGAKAAITITFERK